MIKALRFFGSIFVLGAAICLTPAARAQLVINDTLTGASTTYHWVPIGGACLTAGGGPVSATNYVPACSGLSYYNGLTQVGGTSGRLPDTVGSGALRLTNGDISTGSSYGTYQNGAVVSADGAGFSSNQGLQVTFKTVTYGGNNYGGTGADGMIFFLSDALQPATVGGSGGSLGYSCSNLNGVYDGVAGAYLGIGIDEFGNFGNPGDNTNTGPGFYAGRIAVRGAGHTNFAELNKLYPSYYPSSLSASQRAAAVQNTCASGKYQSYSNANFPVATNVTVPYNYPLLTYSNLPSGVTLYNQEATSSPKRGSATPITYALRITQDGFLDFSYAVNGGATQTVLSHFAITASNGPLPANFRFGFAAGTGGGSNVHEITCFKAAPANAANSSASTNVQQSGKLQQGSQVYLAYYNSLNPWGQLSATTLSTDANGNATLNSLANWDAGCVLTGGACQSTGASSVTAQGSSARTMLTWNATTGTGIPFQWANLVAAQKTALTVGDASQTDMRLRYMRGDRSNEIANTGSTLRTRTGVLGDIVDSSPTWVGAPGFPYAISWKDTRYPSAAVPEASGSYANYTTFNATRTNVVYVGANDGFLHGFRAGYSDASGNFQSSAAAGNDGTEVMAYMPNAILSMIHSTTANIDYPGTQYSHNFYVDATPAVGDLYYGNAWHTWLIGGAGYGGNASGAIGDATTVAAGVMFGLDVTNPTNFKESNAGAMVLGEWTSSATSSSLVCVSNLTCYANLGGTVGMPIIRRLHSGNWAVLFGNGLNSSTGKAGLFIMLVDSTTGARTFRYLDTGVGTTSNRNGIASVTSADLDGDHIVDYVYAGDVLGNLWRFDLTSNDPTVWAASSSPLFTTPSGQPISTAVTVASVPAAQTGGLPRVVVNFGTGRQFPQTLTSATSYASGTQYLYGIWDWNLSTWSTAAAAGARYASLTAPQTVNTTNLLTQTTSLIGTSKTYRTVSNAAVCWSGTTVCGSSGNNKFGWMMQLPSTNEQIVFSPVLQDGNVLVNTIVPSVSQALSCDVQPPSGFTMAVSAANGGATQSAFSDASNNALISSGSVVAGIGLSASGSPSIVSSGTRKYLVQQTVAGTAVVQNLTNNPNGVMTRVNWKQLR